MLTRSVSQARVAWISATSGLKCQWLCSLVQSIARTTQHQKIRTTSVAREVSSVRYVCQSWSRRNSSKFCLAIINTMQHVQIAGSRKIGAAPCASVPLLMSRRRTAHLSSRTSASILRSEKDHKKQYIKYRYCNGQWILR